MLISSVIGATAALGSAALGAIQSGRAGRRVAKSLQDERDRVKNWYEYRTAQDFTSRSDNQAVINRSRELLAERYRNTRATNVVAGGSEESLAAQKQAANDAMAQTMGNIAAGATNYKEGVEQQYQQREAQLNQAQMNLEQQKSQNIAQAGGQAVGAALNLIGTGLTQTPQAPQVATTPAQAAAPVVTGPSSLQTAQTGLDNTIKVDANQQIKDAAEQLAQINGVLPKKRN